VLEEDVFKSPQSSPILVIFVNLAAFFSTHRATVSRSMLACMAICAAKSEIVAVY
jgi:hypothetical protein